MDAKLDVPHSEGQDESDVSDGYDVPPPAYRRNSESSTERSLYDEKDQAVFFGQQASSSQSHVCEYGWYHPKVLSRGLVVTDADASTPTSKAPLYYVEVSEFALKKPDVILHALPSTTGMTNDLEHLANTGESGPVVGVAHLPKLSRHIKVGLGDPSSSDKGMTYVEVRNANLVTHGEFHMTLDGRSYAWKRTHAASAGVEGSSAATRFMHRESFQLLDVSSGGDVVAVFLDNKFKSWKKKGKLRIFRDLEQQPSEEARRLKLLIFLSIAAILEKARRRANRRRSNGGGGGGGGGT